MALLDGITTPMRGAFALFKLRTAYTGACIRVKDSLNVEEDIGFNDANELDVAALSGNTPYKIVRWYDQSNQVTPQDWTNTTGSGEPTLDLTEDGLRFNNSVLFTPDYSALTAAECFVYRKIDADPSGAGTGGMWHFGTAASSSHIPYSDGNIYDAFATNVRKDAISNPTPSMTAYHIYSVYSAPSDWAASLDGTQLFSTGSNSVALPAAPTFGRGIGTYIEGYVRAVLFFSAKTDSGQRSWLATMANYVPTVTLFQPTHAGTFEIIPAKKSLTLVKVVTRSSADVSLDFSVHKVKAIQVTGDLTPPIEPASMNHVYDGANLEFKWTASPTEGVSSYLVTDEVDRVVTQVSSKVLSYPQGAQADQVTRRVYAVSSSGVLSSGYAEDTWVKPVAAEYVNLSNVTISDDGLKLQKTSGAGWNAGALISKSIYTFFVAAELSGAPDRNDVEQVFGFTVNSPPVNVSSFSAGIHFKADGTVNIANGASLGTYIAGDRFIIDVIPDLPLSTSSTKTVTYSKLVLVDGILVKQLLATVNGVTILGKNVGIAIYTATALSDLRIRLNGMLTDVAPYIPQDAANISNATYNASLGFANPTSASGWGTSGLSLLNTIPEGADGGFEFRFTASIPAIGNTAAGLSPTDPNTNVTSMPFHVRLAGVANQIDLYNNTTNVQPVGFSYMDDLIFMGRVAGLPVVMVNDVVQYVGTTALFGVAQLLFDIAFQSMDGDIYDIKKLQTYTSEVIGSDPLPQGILFEKSVLLGENRADEIPKFNINSVATGDAVTFDENGHAINTKVPVEIPVFLSDEVTDLTVGTNKVKFRNRIAPITLTNVYAEVSQAPTGATIIVDINKGGTTILSTKLSIDATETDSVTAASQAVISVPNLALHDELEFDIDQIGSTLAGKGLKVWLVGYRNA